MEKFKPGLFKAKISFKYLRNILPKDIKDLASENDKELTGEQVNEIKQKMVLPNLLCKTNQQSAKLKGF